MAIRGTILGACSEVRSHRSKGFSTQLAFTSLSNEVYLPYLLWIDLFWLHVIVTYQVLQEDLITFSATYVIIFEKILKANQNPCMNY